MSEPVGSQPTTVDPSVLDVVIEIPTGSRNKYEYDHERHLIRLDRRLFTATAYPADYGFVPDTLSQDGDPLDALVLVTDPTFPGCLVRARILGVFFMRDEAGKDAKLITVLEHDPQWDGATDLDDVPKHLLNEIEHFFSIYKDLEPSKSTEVLGFEDRAAALRELDACRAAYGAEGERVGDG
jgi:inorganic pyrophosphatase